MKKSWFRRPWSLAAVFATAVAVCTFSRPATAQVGAPIESHPIGSINFGGRGGSSAKITRRTIVGSVQDASGKHLSGAVVYIKNLKTSSIQAINADDQGNYQFSELPLTEDFQLWAVVNGKQSPIRPVSSFLQDTSVTIILKIDNSPAAPSN